MRPLQSSSLPLHFSSLAAAELATAEHFSMSLYGLPRPALAQVNGEGVDWQTPEPAVQVLAAWRLVQLPPETRTSGKFSSQGPLQLLSRLSHWFSVDVRLPEPSRLMLGAPE